MSDRKTNAKKRSPPALHTLEPWRTGFPGFMFRFQAWDTMELKDNYLRIAPPTHAWTMAASLPAARRDVDFSRIPDEPPRWAYGGRIMRALKGWLSALQWTAGGEVSNIELAIDFEIFTGVDVPGPPTSAEPPSTNGGKQCGR